MSNVLDLNGLSIEMLHELSYKSNLGLSLKKDLKYFDRGQLIDEIIAMTEWYDTCEVLVESALDYRIKSKDSVLLKYDRYYPDHQCRKVFNDVLGFRAFCDSYQEVLALEANDLRVADLSVGKANDDGYRGVHVYYQIDNSYYPIEIQFNTLYDRQFNNWLHQYFYKKGYRDEIGRILRESYELGKIRSEADFKEALGNVLFDSKRSK